MIAALVAFLHRTPDLAEEFRGHADVAGNLVLGYTLCYEGIFFKELQISFFRGL